MLPKGPLGRQYYRRLYVYSAQNMLLTTKLVQKEKISESEIFNLPNWVKV
jgi:ribosomal protein L13